MSNRPPARVGDDLDAIETPALILDLDPFERNVVLMANAVRGSGVALRPHAKAHKCPAIAKVQVAHGAIGVCCQTVSEAVAFVTAGITDVLVTNEVLGASKQAWLAALARDARIAVLADDAGNVAALDAAARAAGTRLRVLVEVDVGAHRCGVAPGASAVDIARAIADASSLDFGGIHAYHGGAQHRRTPSERRSAIGEAVALAGETRKAIEAEGIICPTVTGAGTGTWQLERDSGAYTELQPGSYIFMDADYARNAVGPDQHVFEQSLFVLATVMSTPAPDRVIIDAGLKALAFDSGPPLVHSPLQLVYEKGSDEHGVISVPQAVEPPTLGERVWLIPGHCDPTVNLHDWIIGVRGDSVECVWPVTARGY